MGTYIFNLRQKRYNIAVMAHAYYGSIIMSFVASIAAILYWLFKWYTALFIFDMFVVDKNPILAFLFVLFVFVPIFMIKQHYVEKWSTVLKNN